MEKPLCEYFNEELLDLFIASASALDPSSVVDVHDYNVMRREILERMGCVVGTV